MLPLLRQHFTPYILEQWIEMIDWLPVASVCSELSRPFPHLGDGSMRRLSLAKSPVGES